MNLRPLLSRLSIVDKDSHLRPFTLNWAQDIFLEEWQRQVRAHRPVRIIVLKARQIGVSTIAQGIEFAYAMLFDNLKGLVVAHENDSSEYLLSMTDTFWQTFPFNPLFTQKYNSRKDKSWIETRSRISVKTARNVAAGRGRTVTFLHASEVAFWEDPATLMTGLSQTIPESTGTAIVLESTANGIGNYFHKQWNDAMRGDSDFVPLFFPWWAHPEYRRPHDRPLGYLDPEEQNLMALFREGLEIGPYRFDLTDSDEIDAALKWRRWAIRNRTEGDIDSFHQEYPATPDEAFLSSGTNIFPLEKLQSIYKQKKGQRGRLIDEGNDVRFVPDSRGPLTVFKKPSKDTDWGVYVVGGDPTHTTRGDYACAQVINRRTLEQVAVLRVRCTPAHFGYELARLGYYYNTALLGPETEGPGYNTIGVLQGINYPNLWQHQSPDRTPGKVTGDIWGWRTSKQTKHLAVGYLLQAVVDSDLTVYHDLTFSEMRDYISLEDGGYGPADGSDYDDTVMALAIAVTCHFMAGPIMPFEGMSDEGELAGAGVGPAWERWGESEGGW